MKRTIVFDLVSEIHHFIAMYQNIFDRPKPITPNEKTEGICAMPDIRKIPTPIPAINPTIEVIEYVIPFFLRVFLQ